MYYNDGYHRTKVYDVRPLKREYLSPMVTKINPDLIQVKIKFLGRFLIWINVDKKYLEEQEN